MSPLFLLLVLLPFENVQENKQAPTSTEQNIALKGVDHYLNELTGPDFVDCGGYIVGIPEDWEIGQKKVLDCAMRAVAEKKHFNSETILFLQMRSLLMV